MTLGDPGLGTEVETEKRCPPSAHLHRRPSVPVTDAGLGGRGVSLPFFQMAGTGGRYSTRFGSASDAWPKT
jgi:hypothetical protein